MWVEDSRDDRFKKTPQTKKNGSLDCSSDFSAHAYIYIYININAYMLGGSLVTTAWRVLRLQTEEMPSEYARKL
jgi:hypothetical protein